MGGTQVLFCIQVEPSFEASESWLWMMTNAVVDWLPVVRRCRWWYLGALIVEVVRCCLSHGVFDSEIYY